MELLNQKFSISESYIQLGHLVVYIDSKDNKDVLAFLKDELGYEMLIEMSAIDWLADRGGYEIFYEMLNFNTRKRMRLKMFLNKDHAIESVSDIFRSAELRDSAQIDRYDTERFARLGHEVSYGVEVTAETERSEGIRFQEDGGVFAIKKFDPEKTKTLNEQERKR